MSFWKGSPILPMQQNHKHFWEKNPCEKTVLQIASISPFSSAANSKRDAAFFGHVKKRTRKTKGDVCPWFFGRSWLKSNPFVSIWSDKPQLPENAVFEATSFCINDSEKSVDFSTSAGQLQVHGSSSSHAGVFFSSGGFASPKIPERRGDKWRNRKKWERK